MSTQTQTWLFDSHANAVSAVRDLESAGFAPAEVSIMARQATTEPASDTPEGGAGVGAAVGTLAGGGAALLAGLGVIAIPGIGPLVAAGWFATMAAGAGAGALTGGLIGSLTGTGVPERDAHVYAEGLSRGGTIVTVRTDPSRMGRAADIVVAHQPVHMATREAEYRTAGWQGYVSNEAGHPLRDVPDGAPGNPPGTMASRAVDDIAGTNISGARPQNERPPRA
jgi:hypothetical protein